MQIHILSAPIQTGKTTSLLNYCAHHPNSAGILSPVLNGKRYFYSVCSRESRAMEAGVAEIEILEIGKYKFSQTAFNWAIEQLRKDVKSNPSLLILDEIGPLELKGKGFATILKEILQLNSDGLELLLVIRESALKEVLAYFEIDEKITKPWLRK